MSAAQRTRVRRNARILGIVAVAAAVVLAGAYFGHKLRKRVMVQRALTEGCAAYDRGDWPAAGTMLRRYLSAHPNDASVLSRYVQAQLRVRPLPRENILHAINACRTLLRIGPADEAVFRQLVLLYETTGNFGELAYIAGQRRELFPDDPQATLAQAKVLIHRKKTNEARAELEQLASRLAALDRPQPEFVEACLLLSAVAQQGGGNASHEQALNWANLALAADPQSAPALVQRATLQHELAQQSQGAARTALLAAARVDLERAEQLPSIDPLVRLMLSEQWMAHGAFERAAAQLRAAQQSDAETVAKFFGDPGDWAARHFNQAAKLSLLTGTTDQGIQLAHDTLAQLQDRPHRLQILPMVIELLVAGKQVGEARQCLADYVDAVKLRSRASERDEQTTCLQAIVARAEDRPYRVIELLAPLIDRPGTHPVTRTLLAEAYASTGQLARVVGTLSKESASRMLTRDSARMLARACLARGAWAEARDALRSLEGTLSPDADDQMLRLAAEAGLACEQPPAEAQAALTALTNELRALGAANPGRVEVPLLLATIAERQNQINEAEAALKGAVERCSDSLTATLSLAALYVRHGRSAEALDLLHAACEQHAALAAPWLALSDVLVSRQEPEAARAALREALEKTAAREEEYHLALRLASLEIVHGDRAAGVAALRDLAVTDPGDLRVRTLLLGLPETTRDAALAGQYLEEIKRVEGESGLLWRLNQARLWLAQADWREQQGEVAKLLKYCINADSHWTAPILLLGGMYEDLGDLAAAEDTYANGFKFAGSTEVADRHLALLQRQKRFAEARDLLNRLNQKLDARGQALRRAVLAMGAGQNSEAISALELRLHGDQKDPLDLIVLARLVYAEQHDVARALDYLRQAAGLAPDLIAVPAARVSILKQEQRLDEAAAVLDELVRTRPTPEAYLLRAAYHTSIGQTDRAEKDYRELARSAADSAGYAALGDFYAQAGRLDEAIAAWDDGLARYPDALDLQRGVAKALITRGRLEDRQRARQLLTDLAKRAPDDTDLLWVQAVDALSDGTPERISEVRALLRRAVCTSPAAAETYARLVRVALQLQEYATARDLAIRGRALNPDENSLSLLQAQAELELHNPEAARELAQSVLAVDRKNLPAHELVVAAATRQHATVALQDESVALERLVDAEPNSETLQLLRAKVAAGLGQSDAALAALERFCAADRTRETLPVLLSLHDLYLAKQDYTSAGRRLDAAAALAPDDPHVVYARLRLLAAEKKFDDLVALAESPPSADQPQPDRLISGAKLLAESPAHLDHAVRLCERATRAAPDSVSAHLTLGDLCYRKGDLPRAEAAYRKVLEKSPSQPAALNNLAWILAETGSASDEAVALARRAVELRPLDADCRDTLGFVLKRSGKPKEACAEFRRSVDLAPQGSPLRARALFHLAQASHEIRDPAPIEDYLAEALAIHRDSQVFNAQEQSEIDRLLRATREEE